MHPASRVPAWALRAIPLPGNRVGRFYRGGSRIDAFRGLAEAGDDGRPEDWVGSVTRTWTRPGAAVAETGPSRLANGKLLRDLLEEAPEALVGTGLVAAVGATTGLLVKLLDPEMRLPVHCHPTRPFARRVLGSPFGKTEAWLIQAAHEIPGQEPPHLRLGFTRDVPAAELRAWIEEQRSDDLLGAMHRRPAVAGETWLIPAGLPHAIGAGVFLVEVQEPTDFSVVAETAGFAIDVEDASLGRGWDVMLDAFDRRGYTDEGIDGLRSAPEPVPSGEERPRMTRLLGPAADPFFRVMRLTLPPASRSDWPRRDSFAVVVVARGAGELRAPGGQLPLRAGETFALPATAASGSSLVSYGGLELIICLPPEPAQLAAGET